MYVWVLGTGVWALEDWRSAERLMAGLFLYGVGDMGKVREKIGESYEVWRKVGRKGRRSL